MYIWILPSYVAIVVACTDYQNDAQTKKMTKRLRTRNKTCNIGNYLPHLLVYIDKLPAFDNIDAVNEEHIYNIHYKQ